MGQGSHGRHRRHLLGGASTPLAQEIPGAAVREYLSTEQVAEVTPWSVEAIEKMVRRGVLKRDVHYFQPFGRRTQLVFKWSAIVALIEGDHPKSDDAHGHQVVDRRGQLDVEKAKAGLGRLLGRSTG